MSYQIRDWDSRFETHETRKLEYLKWVPVPNKHDGLAFRKIAKQKNACELFTAWNLMLQIASKNRKGERGKLSNDGISLTPDDMELMTGFSAKVFETALAFFTSKEIAWLESVDSELLTQSPEEAGESAVQTGSSAAQTPLNGMEGKEGNGMEKKGMEYPPAASPDFVSAFEKWMKVRKELGKKPKDWTAMFQEQIGWLQKFENAVAIEVLGHSTRNCYQGLFPPKGGTPPKPIISQPSIHPDEQEF